ncbi:DUF2189 domain-containing protein [Albidovulum sediminicola]|uniref:DUF2189 domain-containing protein n=1 Tax=Albidovulum sediminicola TaxID=2984331 RepID=A0ABT2YYF6_9RHOB|nr:DUF2189 domain-containing protein [Defluviimonas sp. WL0075]MCV2863812.1 DUF2189 domain-containing protein [Defluviimonas sp. WL0075]
MVRTIGNPLSWGLRQLGTAGDDIGKVSRRIGGTGEIPRVRALSFADLGAALRLGLRDFAALRTDVIAAAMLYPLAGICMVWAAWHGALLHLVFPIASGFALVGPAVAIGFYEMSRRREAGQAANWLDGFRVLASPAFGVMFIGAMMLAAVFFGWLLTAYFVFLVTMGPEIPMSAQDFVRDVLTTPSGWAMIAIGVPLGAVYAAMVLASAIVTFPLLLDRDVGLPAAIVTSLRVTRAAPGPVLAWGAIVAGLLVLGTIPLFLGLAIVLPVLGHASWHLYRLAVRAE